jgi:putative membrane protein
MKQYIILVIKGIAMGTANVIPGVSGGTIALITGIFERLINSIKSFNTKAIALLFKGRIREFIVHTDLWFLFSVLAGVLIAVVSLARLFDYLFTFYPVYIWSYFFGLVLASVYFVGKTIDRWKVSVIITFIIGTAIAVFISFLNPAAPNDGVLYIMLCGAIAVCSMILPGLSGSFVLFIMGNYKLVAIDAINEMDLRILIPFFIGAAAGILAFAHLLSWILKRFKDETISILTGFILGSVSILWPWQKKVFLLDQFGNELLKKGEPIVVSYQRYWPDSLNFETILAIIIILIGIMSIWLIEKTAEKKS